MNYENFTELLEELSKTENEYELKNDYSSIEVFACEDYVRFEYTNDDEFFVYDVMVSDEKEIIECSYSVKGELIVAVEPSFIEKNILAFFNSLTDKLEGK